MRPVVQSLGEERVCHSENHRGPGEIEAGLSEREEMRTEGRRGQGRRGRGGKKGERERGGKLSETEDGRKEGRGGEKEKRYS